MSAELHVSEIVAEYEKDLGRPCACGCGKRVFGIRETKRYASRLCRNRHAYAERVQNGAQKKSEERAKQKRKAIASRTPDPADVDDLRPSIEQVRRRIFGDRAP